jgi:hypothetical protein
MLRLTGETLRRLAREARGTEIAEAALVLPLMFMMLLGIFWFGQAFRIYGTITHSAREGARAGAAPSCSSCAVGSTASQKAYNAVQSALAAGKLDIANAKPPSSAPSLVSCLPGGPTPTCDAAFPKLCIQRNIQLSDPTSGGAGVCGISVSFQYPYQFWFPGTNLNNQLIQLHAVARVRMETQ